jgi:hypothetical protein
MLTELYNTTDTSELFAINKARLGPGWVWADSKISYNHNSSGYRMNKEITAVDNKYMLFLGCSHTYGTGLPLEETWAYKLAAKYGIDYINAATPGSSAEYLVSTLVDILEQGPPPTITIINWPIISRSVYYTDSGPVHLSVGWLDQNPNHIYRHAWRSQLLSTVNLHKKFNIMRQTAQVLTSLAKSTMIEFTQTPSNIGIPVLNTIYNYEQNPASVLSDIDFLNAHIARDVQRQSDGWLGHYGLSQQQLIVDYCSKTLGPVL